MGGVPKVVTMDTLILSHWDMVDCLFDEIYLGKHDDTLHSREPIEELFRYFASHDPRFHAVGLRWNIKGYLEYTDPEGRTYRAEGAIAVFLGLGTKTVRGSVEASHLAINLIYKRFDTKVDARVWLRWHVQKLHGYDNKQRDLWKDYPRDFPSIASKNNELLSQKD